MSKSDQQETDRGNDAKEPTVGYRAGEHSDIDFSLLKDSLAKTPWERMQANDDALNFADSLRTAMRNRYAKS